MKSMKFYIYASNLAIVIFGALFIFLGYSPYNMILLDLGIALALYGLLRLYRMLRAVKNTDDEDGFNS